MARRALEAGIIVAEKALLTEVEDVAVAVRDASDVERCPAGGRHSLLHFDHHFIAWHHGCSEVSGGQLVQLVEATDEEGAVGIVEEDPRIRSEVELIELHAEHHRTGAFQHDAAHLAVVGQSIHLCLRHHIHGPEALYPVALFGGVGHLVLGDQCLPVKRGKGNDG